MFRRAPLSRLLCASVAVCAAASLSSPSASRAAQDPMKHILHPNQAAKVHGSSGSTLATLTNGTGDRSLTVTVDAFGSFGSASAAGDATFDPIGPIGPSGTVFLSGVYFSEIGTYLATGFGGLSPIPFASVSQTTAESAFRTETLVIHLTQTVSRTPNGSIFVQAYEITNVSSETESFGMTRHVDGDLQFDGSITDFGGVAPDGRTLYEFDAGDDPSAASTFVGITDSGGTPAGFTIQEYEFADDIVQFNGIPSSVLNQVFNDGNGDRVTDIGYDVTLSLASHFSIAPSQTAVYTTTTRFGDQTLTPRATITWDPPDPNAPVALPPPEHLRAIPLDGSGTSPGAGAPGAAAPGAAAPGAAIIAEARADVTGYNVYSSTTSPVVPSPENLFTSVPPTQTSADVPTSSSGSFFVVTAEYGNDESGPSNEASADVPAATLTSVKVTAAKIVGKGTDFSSTVQVFLDGIPFASPAKVKNGKKVVQKGTLVTGQTVGAYVASKGGVVLVQFRNSNGGIASRRYPQ